MFVAYCMIKLTKHKLVFMIYLLTRANLRAVFTVKSMCVKLFARRHTIANFLIVTIHHYFITLLFQLKRTCEPLLLCFIQAINYEMFIVFVIIIH